MRIWTCSPVSYIGTLLYYLYKKTRLLTGTKFFIAVMWNPVCFANHPTRQRPMLYLLVSTVIELGKLAEFLVVSIGQFVGQSKLNKVQGRVLSKLNKLKFNIEETSFFSQLT